jgi:beta-galactosidase
MSQPSAPTKTSKTYKLVGGKFVSSVSADSQTFFVQNVAGGLFLADPQSSAEQGTVMIEWPFTGGPEQEWVLEPTGPGNEFFAFQNAASGLYLADPQSSQSDGTEIVQWPATGGTEQMWQVVPSPSGTDSNIVNYSSGKYLAVPQGSPSPGTSIIQYQATGGTEQRWIFYQ